MNPYDKAHELAQAIRESDAFVKMKSAKTKLEVDKSAKIMLLDVERKQLNLERKRLLGQPISEEEQASLSKLLEIVQMHEVVHEYLEAEMQVGILYQDIQQIIGDAIQEASLLLESLTDGLEVYANETGSDWI